MSKFDLTSMFSDDEESDFIAYIYPDRLKEILIGIIKISVAGLIAGNDDP